MFVLGIDPGLSRCGYACLRPDPGRRGSAVPAALGVLRTPPDQPHHERLADVQLALRDLMAEHRPTVVAIERVFFQTNVRTALGVAQVVGLAMAEAVAVGAEVAEYTPNQVKEAVAGWGAAPKAQMQEMIRMLLGLDSIPKPADAADAAAVALCHLAHAPLASRAARGAVAGGRR